MEQRLAGLAYSVRKSCMREVISPEVDLHHSLSFRISVFLVKGVTFLSLYYGSENKIRKTSRNSALEMCSL